MNRKQTSFQIPSTFVGTFYDVQAGIYISTRKDGSITVGKMNQRGVNVRTGSVFVANNGVQPSPR